MADHPFPDCREECDGTWRKTLGHGTLRPCLCRRRASMMAKARLVLVAVVAVIGGVLVWLRLGH